MKRALAVLLAMTLATSASATPTSTGLLVVRYPIASSVDPISISQQLGVIQAIGDQYGADMNFTSAQFLTTLCARNGRLPIANGASPDSLHFAAVVHVGPSSPTGFGTQLCRPDSMTLGSTTTDRWPRVPQIWIGQPGAISNQWLQVAGTCSTASAGYASGWASARQYYSMYMVGSSQVNNDQYTWKHMSSNVKPYGVPMSRSGNGIVRVVVSYGPTAITSSADLVTFSDAVALTKSANPDSALLWVKYRDTNDTAPWIFVQPGGAWQDIGLIKMALAIADSITGGGVFSHPEKLPHIRAALIRHAFSTGHYNSQNSNNGGGVFCYADSCDSSNVLSTIGSLNSLNIPITVAANAESIATNQYQLRWWNAYYRFRFILEDYGGTSATGIAGNASTSSIQDVFGRVRTRSIFPEGFTTWPPTCTSDTLSTACHLTRALALLEAALPGRVIKAVLPAYGDYSPTSWTLTGATGRDSLDWMLHKLGIGTVLFGIDQIGSNPGRHWSATSGLVTTNATAPSGYGVNSEARRVRSSITSGGYIGRVKYVRIRNEINSPYYNVQSGHAIGSEWQYGDLGIRWYVTPLTRGDYYNHDFVDRTSVIAYTIGQLGGSGDGLDFAPEGYYGIKWINEEMKTCDALMLSGKKLDVWGYVDQVKP